MKPIGLIDGDALRKEYLLAGKNKLSLAAVISRLEMMPTLYPVDAVTVVRCKDCVHYSPLAFKPSIGDCRYWLYEERIDSLPVYEDDWCSYGERKDDQQCK